MDHIFYKCAIHNVKDYIKWAGFKNIYKYAMIEMHLNLNNSKLEICSQYENKWKKIKVTYSKNQKIEKFHWRDVEEHSFAP